MLEMKVSWQKCSLKGQADAWGSAAHYGREKCQEGRLAVVSGFGHETVRIRMAEGRWFAYQQRMQKAFDKIGDCETV